MRRTVFAILSLTISHAVSGFTIRKASRLNTAVRGGPQLLPVQLATAATSVKDNQAEYLVDVQVGGNNFTLVLDTGSSDLWIAPRPEINYNQLFTGGKIFSDLPLNFTYGTGSVAGNVAQLDNVGFAGYTANNQSLLYVVQQDDFFNQAESQDPLFDGIAGVGFDTLSSIANAVYSATRQTWGRSLLSNIFLANPTLPNHIAIFLDRLGYLNDTGFGTFDIGTYASGYEAVANQPKHSVYSGFQDHVNRWNLLVSDLKINGKSQTLETGIVPNEQVGLVNIPPTGSISALLDTGSTLGQLPSPIWKALYEGMGGVLVEDQSFTQGTPSYAVPCMAEAQLEFTFGNQAILVHPLDLTNLTIINLPDGRNLTACLSYYESNDKLGADVDIILGDSFLRNVYAVYDFGNLTSGLSGLGGNPFIQLLPLTDASKASSEFKAARANALSQFPPEVDVSTINDRNPKVSSGSSGSSGGSGSSNAAANALGPAAISPLYLATFLMLLNMVMF